MQLRAALAPEISEESCVIVGLFHDIGKVGMPGKPYHLPEIKDGKPTGAYTINPEIVAMGLSLRSLSLVSQYIPLSDAKAQAIAYHDGMYVPEGRSVAHKEEPLLLLLHWADMWTASVREKIVYAYSIHQQERCPEISYFYNIMCIFSDNLSQSKLSIFNI